MISVWFLMYFFDSHLLNNIKNSLIMVKNLNKEIEILRDCYLNPMKLTNKQGKDDTFIQEFKTFLSLCIQIGLVKMPSLHDY